MEEEQRQLAGMSDFEKLARIEALTGEGKAHGATLPTPSAAKLQAGAPAAESAPFMQLDTSTQLLKTQPQLDQQQPLTRDGLRQQVPYVAKSSPGGQRAAAVLPGAGPTSADTSNNDAWMSRIASFMDMPPAAAAAAATSTGKNTL